MLLVGSYVKLTKKPYESFPVDTTMLGKVIQIEKDNILVKYANMNMAMSFDEYDKYFTSADAPNPYAVSPVKFHPVFTEWKIFDSSFLCYLNASNLSFHPFFYYYKNPIEDAILMSRAVIPTKKQSVEIEE